MASDENRAPCRALSRFRRARGVHRLNVSVGLNALIALMIARWTGNYIAVIFGGAYITERGDDILSRATG